MSARGICILLVTITCEKVYIQAQENFKYFFGTISMRSLKAILHASFQFRCHDAWLAVFWQIFGMIKPCKHSFLRSGKKLFFGVFLEFGRVEPQSAVLFCMAAKFL